MEDIVRFEDVTPSLRGHANGENKVMTTNHDKSSNEAVFPTHATRETWASRLNNRNAFRKTFSICVKVHSNFLRRGTSDRFKEACGTWDAKAGSSAGRRTPTSDPLSSRTRTVVEPPFVARENWGAGSLMNILWMHISRHHGITRCRRVPDKAPPLKNGPSYLSHKSLMGPIPASSRSNVFTFSRVTGANLHLMLRRDGGALSDCLCEIPLHYGPEVAWKDE